MMLNKKLEQKLKKGGFNDIVRWIEKCESGRLVTLEIRVDKDAGLTGDKVLDKAVLDYLKKLKIKVMYNEFSGKKKEVPVCTHFSHKLYNKKLKHADNVDNFLDNKIAVFKIDEKASESYAICPQCTVMITIS